MVITWETEMTKPAAIKGGLRQGCPLLLLLFMVCLGRIEKKFEEYNLGVVYKQGFSFSGFIFVKDRFNVR